jgi:hypothetical protein
VAGVEEFEKRRKRARRVDGSELEVAKEQLPAETETVILRPCC